MQKNEFIRPLAARHIGPMAEIEKLCFSQPWSLETLEYELDNPLAFYLVAEDEGGDVLGYIGTRLILDECHITNVAVHPEHRRKGVARRLLQALEEALLNNNFLMMTLEVRESNQAARGFYASFGFKISGKRRNYYDLPTEDAILMTKSF